ncbi:MAG: YHYH domain-containing protein [Pseudomonadota bacterium]
MKLLIACLITLATTLAVAHSGGTNSNGCHNETRTGGYHCH